MSHAPYRPLALAALLAAAGAGCAPVPPPHRYDGPGRGPPPGGGFRRLFLSPMGEPFRGSPEGGGGVRSWFDGADANHDGQISLAEFAADADRFFQTLDTDHDGEIGPAELDRYETVIAPEIAAHGMAGGGRGGGRHGGPGGGMGGGGMGGGHGGRRGGAPDGGGSGGSGAPEGRQGAGRFSFLDIPEPVVSADRDFNRGVSRAEFARIAGQRFLLLDTAHHGYLTFATLPPLPARGGRGGPRPRGGDATAPDAP